MGRCRSRGRRLRRLVRVCRRWNRWSRRLRRAFGGGRSDRLGSGARGQESERVDVSLLVCRDADAEVHVGLRPVLLAARPDDGHGCALRDRVPFPDVDRPQMLQGDREPVGGTDRKCLASSGDGARKGHDARSRSLHVDTGVAGDVDASVLPAGVGIVPEHERTQHPSCDGPRPRLGRGRHQPCHESQEQDQSTHIRTPLFSNWTTADAQVSVHGRCCQYCLQGPCPEGTWRGWRRLARVAKAVYRGSLADRFAA